MALYAYIIVGGGAAGCALARRLSARSTNRVLLLEAGLVSCRRDILGAALAAPVGLVARLTDVPVDLLAGIEAPLLIGRERGNLRVAGPPRPRQALQQARCGWWLIGGRGHERVDPRAVEGVDDAVALRAILGREQGLGVAAGARAGQRLGHPERELVSATVAAGVGEVVLTTRK